MKPRTLKQNSALHLCLQQVADTMIEYGLTMNELFVDIRPTMESMKVVFRDVARKKYGVKSTADLTTTQIQEVFEDFAKAIEQETGEEIVWPSIAELVDKNATM